MVPLSLLWLVVEVILLTSIYWNFLILIISVI